MSKVTIRIERIGELAQLEITREGKDPIVINMEDVQESIGAAGEVSAVEITGVEVPFE